MTQSRPDSIERARALRAQGLSLREIAEQLGVSAKTIARWTDPEQAELDRKRSREAKQARRRPCERCSAPLSYDRPGGLCQTCRHTDAHARLERVACLYERGQDPRQIATAVAISEGYAHELLHRLARSGRIQPRWALRDRDTVHGREQQILALHTQGRSHAQIAETIRLSQGSVNQVLVRLRQREAA